MANRFRQFDRVALARRQIAHAVELLNFASSFPSRRPAPFARRLGLAVLRNILDHACPTEEIAREIRDLLEISSFE